MPSRRRPVASDKRFRHEAPRTDYGTPERWQHSGRTLELTDRAGILAARATEEHVLDSLVLCGLLDDSQRAAGLKLRLDYQRAALAAPVTSQYSPVGGRAAGMQPGRERNELEEMAYRRWRHALKELGIVLARPVLVTVCHDEWPQPGEIRLLQQGLEKLAKIYGLTKTNESLPVRPVRR